jgi:plasmid stability protein
MADVTLHNLPDEVHSALKARAAQNQRSVEAEIYVILEAAVRPPDRLLMGTALANLSRKFGLTNADVEALEDVRDKTPAEPMRF